MTIMKITRLFNDFFESEKAGGLILILVTVISLLLANSPWQTNYINLWHFDIGGHSLTHWINDGLMTIFFLLIGLELDIAFAIGILSLLGNRVPISLKIFLTALAVIDDLGAILVIAIFYTSTIIWANLFIALGIFVILLIFNRLKIRNLIPYLIGGILMWYFMLNSGVHATITGVLLAFAIPFGNGDEKSSSFILQHFLHKPVAFFILPLFAIANTCIAIGDNWQEGLGQTNSLGIMIGLVLGKPLGIFIFAFLGATLGFCSLPADLNWKNIISVGFLGGIGFTMSIFVTLLAFDNDVIIDNSKIAILISSIIAGLLGFIFLKLTLTTEVPLEEMS
jgi:NhaA family Na+:H+ antiporter